MTIMKEYEAIKKGLNMSLIQRKIKEIDDN